jgi:hypothetical protein
MTIHTIFDGIPVAVDFEHRELLRYLEMVFGHALLPVAVVTVDGIVAMAPAEPASKRPP